MKQALDNGTWFNLDLAQRFDEGQTWDGSNHISRATGSQWDHETLYHTPSGRWVLHWRSQWQGAVERWTEIDSTDAARWLVRNEHELPAYIVEEVNLLEI